MENEKWVKRCCASCAYKQLTRAVNWRRCRKHRRLVSPHDVCDNWKMKQIMKY